MFGEHGGPEIARRLGIPGRTWYNYEMGVTVPAEVILRFIDLTSVEPTWLLYGRGENYRPQAPRTDADQAAGDGARSVAEFLNQISERLQGGHLVIDVSWKKAKPDG